VNNVPAPSQQIEIDTRFAQHMRFALVALVATALHAAEDHADTTAGDRGPRASSTPPPPERSVWHVRASAIGATALISLAPLVFLPFIPAPTPGSATSTAVQQPALLCFAAGYDRYLICAAAPHVH